MLKSLWVLTFVIMSFNCLAQGAAGLVYADSSGTTGYYPNQSGLITVLVLFNGVPLRMLLDTGAEGCVVYPGAQHKVRGTLDPNDYVGEVEMITASGALDKTGVYKIELRYGNVRTLQGVMFPYTNESGVKRRYDGLLGMSAIRELGLIIDAKKLRVVQRP